MRDANKSGMHVFKLEEVELGTNKWGNPVTSMIVTPIMPSEGAAMGALQFLTAMGLFVGQSRDFFAYMTQLALQADAATRGV